MRRKKYFSPIPFPPSPRILFLGVVVASAVRNLGPEEGKGGGSDEHDFPYIYIFWVDGEGREENKSPPPNF